MSWPVDYHMHTPLCGHAVGEPSEYAAHAQRIGMVEIGFSDHAPLSQDGMDNWRMRQDQLEEYLEKVKKASTDFPSMRVRLALEVDFLPGEEAWIETLSEKYPWDYLIGSVHYISRDWAIDDPSMISKWNQQDPDQIWEQYIDLLIQTAEMGRFEIIGHIDLPKKFGVRPTKDFTGLFRTLFKVVAQKGACIELNTSGLRKDCQEIYPARNLLEIAYAEGVQITFGSDAHAPHEVGYDFEKSMKMAREVGYTQCCTFKNRMRDLTYF